MKIALDASRLAGPATGLHRYVSFLTSPHLRRRHEWIHLSRSAGTRRMEWLLHELPLRAAAARADVIYAPHFWDFPGQSPLPIVTVVHDTWPLDHFDWLDPHHWRHRFVRPLRHAAGVICDSHFTFRELQRHEPRRRGRATVLPIPVSAVFTPDGPETLAGFQLDRFFLAVLSDDPRKNIPFLEQLQPLLPAPLVVVGEIAPKLRDALHLGAVKDETLAILYRRAEALLFPSLYEGYGLPPLEAAACGCPAIVARTSSLPEVMGSDHPGLQPLMLDDWEREANNIFEDPAVRQEYVDAGFRAAGRVTPARAMEMLERFLDEAGGHRP